MQSIGLLDLPDEILVMIFTKFNTVEAFDSLLDTHDKIDKLVYDPIFTNRLTLFKWSSNNIIDLLYDYVIDRLCFRILPKIYNNIKWLNLEFLSIDRILCFAIYPNLYGLGLFNMPIDETVSVNR
ncbi:unnamed protein product [Rotaria sordida]|uniref:F-box domain-containing protein n=1 Tax=Rotaria sordida TaxID=392033 RepID=A0A813ZTV7_9BILA|nr:unnamed protein product [Rotaria sordida]CAF0940028.1 unnamed protein product [Rotaria sordida]CAF0940700.1 unnamed protein product [Rotaria sordida]